MRTKSSVTYAAKAVYYPQPDGGLRLARVQVFDTPRFIPAGWEEINDTKERRAGAFAPDDDAPTSDEISSDVKDGGSDLRRCVRRARRNAYDLIMSNPDLNAFVTYTYSPDAVGDKSSYEECYKYLRTHLSNGVQRDGMKYICVPELTKAGDVHFHAIANADALRLEAARSANTGRLIKHHGDQVYNVTNWHAGFSTAQLVRQRADGDDPREAVAKYIFKYMGKNFGAKIGGRYMLHGGKLATPVYVYGDGVDEFVGTDPTTELASMYEVELPDGNGKYWEYQFDRVRDFRKCVVDSFGL